MANQIITIGRQYGSGALGIDGAVEILYTCAKLFSGKG